MNRSRSRKVQRKKPKTNSKLKYLIAIIALIPVCYGFYLYCQQTVHYSDQRQAQECSSYQILSTDDLDIPITITQREEQIIRHTGYTVSYNKKQKNPNWVSYELTRQETKGREKRKDRFIADPLARGIVAANSDYTRSGYDRGHMAPAADMKWSSTAMAESFYFTNICPQHPDLNRKGWKLLEDKIRNWAVADSAIIVICGPIFDKRPKTIGKTAVAVPQQFFKVILSPFVKPIRAIGFLFNNEQANKSISTNVISIDSIENLTGLNFFAALPDDIENSVESASFIEQWAH